MDVEGTPTTDVDARVAQLQHALTSRIVVEQAKGMLAERYALAPDEAFELIRLAARSNGIKVHTLANSVLSSPRETPAIILAVLSSPLHKSVASARAVENVFRQVNESLLKLDNPRFMCECSDSSCAETISISAETMRHLHNDRNLYVHRPAHINSDLEDLVQRHDEYAVVRKPASAAAA